MPTRPSWYRRLAISAIDRAFTLAHRYHDSRSLFNTDEINIVTLGLLSPICFRLARAAALAEGDTESYEFLRSLSLPRTLVEVNRGLTGPLSFSASVCKERNEITCSRTVKLVRSTNQVKTSMNEFRLQCHGLLLMTGTVVSNVKYSSHRYAPLYRYDRIHASGLPTTKSLYEIITTWRLIYFGNLIRIGSRKEYVSRPCIGNSCLHDNENVANVFIFSWLCSTNVKSRSFL